MGLMAEDVPGDDPSLSNTEPTGVIEFALPNFWRLIKQQKDLESPQIGFSHGFYFRILVHPRGTIGTDSESSHLSVFLEALKQPWFPDDWIFPNVRFDLTVVNWKDPKENVNSWAHWTFCEDTTSRGWQRMLPQSKISRARGFLNEEDTLLVRGKAEPVFWGPWSRRTLTFLPKNLWDSIPLNNYSSDEFSAAKKGRVPATLGGEEAWDLIVPTLNPTLHCDALACIIHILFHIKEFRRLICAWRPRDPANSFIAALQLVFARMHLWPLIICVAAETQEEEVDTRRIIDKPVRDLLSTHNTAVTNSLSTTLSAVYGRQASCKEVLKALGLHCVQKMTFSDPFVELHQKIFSAIHEECKLDYLADLTDLVENGIRHDSSLQPQSLRLDRLIEQLFSVNTIDLNHNRIGDGSYIHSFIKIRHVQSIAKALETNGKKLARFPDVMAVYISPQKTIRKGELFDVPLRLDASFMQAATDEDEESSSGSRKGRDRWYSLYALVIKDGDSGTGGISSSTSSLSASNGFSILIRPEEEGPWFRISDGRVEKLVSKVSFAEWKCHRDFFSSVAIYVSEEFIDTSVSHPVDLRCLNPELYVQALRSFNLPADYLDGLLREPPAAESSLSREGQLESKHLLLSDNATDAAAAAGIPKECFSPFLSVYGVSESVQDLSEKLPSSTVKLPEFPTLDKISKYGGDSGSLNRPSLTSPNRVQPSSSITSSHQQRFYDKVRSLVTDAITRRDATSLNAILAEVFNLAGEGDTDVLSWTLSEASRRALDVASAVDCYLGSGLWDPTQLPTASSSKEATTLPSDLFGGRNCEKSDRDWEGDADKGTASLEDWVTRQVSIVWDLLARVDSFRHTATQAKTAPFADVFCLAILESVEIRVLRNALLPQPPDSSDSLIQKRSPAQTVLATDTPKQHLRLREKEVCLYALPNKLTDTSGRAGACSDDGYRGAKRRCSTGAVSQVSAVSVSQVSAVSVSQISTVPHSVSQPLSSLNAAPTPQSAPRRRTESPSPSPSPHSSPDEEDARSVEPSKGNYRKLLDLFQRSRPSKAKVVSICYGPVAASRRAHEATRRDLLRLKRRSCTESSASGVRTETSADGLSSYAAGVSVIDSSATSSPPSTSSKSLLSQGKRRRSETATFGRNEDRRSSAAVPDVTDAASRLPLSAVAKCRVTRKAPIAETVEPRSMQAVADASSPPMDRESDAPTLVAAFSSKMLSPSLLALKAANAFDSAPTKNAKRIRVCVTFESSLAGLRGSLGSDSEFAVGGVLGSGVFAPLRPSSIKTEETTYLLLGRDIPCATVYSLIAQSLVQRMTEWKNNLPLYDGSSMLATVALEHAQRQLVAARAVNSRGNAAKPATNKASWYSESCESLFSLFLYALSYADSTASSTTGVGNTDNINRNKSGLRVTFLDPSAKLSDYLKSPSSEDGYCQLTSPSFDLQLLVCFGGPLAGPESAKPVVRNKNAKATKKNKKKTTLKNAQALHPPEEKGEYLPHATAKDDLTMPLLIFKWFDCNDVDLLWLGAVPCDARLGLQDVVATWVLFRLLVYLPRLLVPFWNQLSERAGNADLPQRLQAMARNPQEWRPLIQQLESLVSHLDMTNLCVVAEELYTPGNSCSREFQNIRRFNSSVRKLSKKTGDTIVVQWKFDIAAPLCSHPPAWTAHFFKWVQRIGCEGIADVLSCSLSVEEQSERLWKLLYEEQLSVLSSDVSCTDLDPSADASNRTRQQVVDLASRVFALAQEKHKERVFKQLPLDETQSAAKLPERDTTDREPAPAVSHLDTAVRLDCAAALTETPVLAQNSEFTMEVSPVVVPDTKSNIPVVAKKKKKSVHHNRQWRHKHSGNAGGARKASSTSKRKHQCRTLASPADLLSKDDGKSTSSSCSQSSVLAASLSPSSISSCSSNELFKGFEIAWKNRSSAGGGDCLIADLFKGTEISLHSRPTVGDTSLKTKFSPPKGLFLPQFKQCLIQAFEAGGDGVSLVVEDEILRRLVANLAPLSAAELSSSQGWAAAEWASQLDLLVRSARTGLDSAFRTEFPKSFIFTLHLAILAAIEDDSDGDVDSETDSVIKRCSREEADFKDNELFRSADEIDFFQSSLGDRRELLIMVELLSGLFSVSPTFGNRRSLQKLAFSALDVFHHLGMRDADCSFMQTAVHMIDECFYSVRAQVLSAYKVAISVCYTLFLTLYVLPSIFTSGQSGRKFGQSLMRRLRNTFAFAVAVSKIDTFSQHSDTCVSQSDTTHTLQSSSTASPVLSVESVASKSSLRNVSLHTWNVRLLRAVVLVMDAIDKIQHNLRDVIVDDQEYSLLVSYRISFVRSILTPPLLREVEEAKMLETSNATRTLLRQSACLANAGQSKARRWSQEMPQYSQQGTTLTAEGFLSNGEDEDDDGDEEEGEEDGEDVSSVSTSSASEPSDVEDEDFEDDDEDMEDFDDDLDLDLDPSQTVAAANLFASNRRRPRGTFAPEKGTAGSAAAVDSKKSRLRYAIARNRGATQDRSLVSDGASRRKTGRPSVYKDEPRVVRESRTWFVVSKPAFWHCSGPGQSTEHPIDLALLREGKIEEATVSISLPKLQRSGRMESFHLWMMKKYPQLETVRKWTELECGLCHRIDLETSGALLIAKTHRSRDLIWEQFRRRYVHKEYLLLCHGRIKNRQGTVKTRLLTKDYGTNKSRRIKSHFTTVVAEGGEVALTEYHVCKVFKRKPWSELLQVRLLVHSFFSTRLSTPGAAHSSSTRRVRCQV
eukprot:Gregarina_sp_Poly_1__5095@NODE_26_length_19795_cov_50_913828_g24_i0_p1_GENE_NODE_26_length_19795_cov_50_913828_g24_i0NODE_26_length_19795_cov_50_913828_g24_i0_p1_ORF_typecomplete_len2736_score422_92PseudoU_synth_2/PF00849_22/1_4e21MATH/PF00917_26/2_4e08Nop14/PF04147_12/29Nop14/PF04147_12/1_4DNA_pol_phi/PF04931_13/8_5_NODE_26_length_19795_cov_50_913828_g24_i0668273